MEAGADPRVAGGSSNADPAEDGTNYKESKSSICSSDAGISNRSGNKAIVTKVPEPKEYLADPKQRLAAIGP